MAYSFGLDFQRHILASAISDKNFLQTHLDAVKPDLFGDEILAGIAEVTSSFYTSHREVPSKEAIIHELQNQLAPGRGIVEYKEELDAVYAKVGINPKFYQGKAVEFARVQGVGNAIKEAVPLLESGDVDEIGRMVADAVRAGNNLGENEFYDYFGQARTRTVEYISTRNGNKDRLPTGFYPLDEMMQGGLGKGELGIIVALPKHGKTTTLVNMAAHAVLLKKRVLYITLELSQSMIAAKFDTRLFGTTLQDIKKKPAAFAKAIKVLSEEFTGRFHIIGFPTKGMSVERLTGVVLKMGGADVVFVDYGQLIKPPNKRGEVRHELSETYEALRRMAGELAVPVWTAHQANRVGTAQRVLLPEHIAEDFNALAIADIGVSINQTEEERRDGRLRIYNMLSRLGPSAMQVECKVNWATSCISVAADEEELE